MKIFLFDKTKGVKIDKFGSNFIFSRIMRIKAEAGISCFHLGPNGIVGYHQAVIPQLFLVVQGEGWVRNETSEQVPVGVGYAVFWEKDEWHEAGTNTGLMAIVIEGEFLKLPAVKSMEWEYPNYMLDDLNDNRIDERLHLLCNR